MNRMALSGDDVIKYRSSYTACHSRYSFRGRKETKKKAFLKENVFNFTFHFVIISSSSLTLFDEQHY